MNEKTARELLAAAFAASEKAYAPYSNIKMGAALLTDDGQVYDGCNIENISYGLANCAERTAIFKAVSDGHRKFTAIAIVCGDEKIIAYPCGACRQVMNEFFGSSAEVYVAPCNRLEDFETFTVGELLPKGFEF